MSCQFRVFLLIAGVILTISACTNVTARVTAEKIDEVDVTEGTRGTAIDVCEPSTIPNVAFPRQEPVEGPREVMEAELVGVLVLEEGCLRVDSHYNYGSYLPFWPLEFTLDLDDDTVIIVDGDDVVVGRVGEEIYMGGGTGRLSALPDCVREQLPASCKGPFWIVGEGVRLNIKEDPEFIQIEHIISSDRTMILLKKEPILDEWLEESAVISGKLRVYSPQRCPRIQSESGMTDYLLIWPPNYSLQLTDGLVEIIDGDGDLVAREGSDLVLHGSPIPHSWDSEHYRQLYYEIPGDCFGPYWIVGEPKEE
jgi:hypothetical protein